MIGNSVSVCESLRPSENGRQYGVSEWGGQVLPRAPQPVTEAFCHTMRWFDRARGKT